MTGADAGGRAEWLGAAGPTDLVRCGCGARLYLSRRHWARRGFTVCDGCKAVIAYGSLAIVEPGQEEGFMSGVVKRGEEREALRKDLERELRHFVGAFDCQPEWLWSPVTIRFVQAVRPKLELLGGPIEAARREEQNATMEPAYRRADEDERPGDEFAGEGRETGDA